jgi:drug/metabolite transporter (DMT)-like permease
MLVSRTGPLSGFSSRAVFAFAPVLSILGGGLLLVESVNQRMLFGGAVIVFGVVFDSKTIF